MDRTYIIIYEIADKANEEKAIEYLKKFNGWARITDNSFAVKSKELKATDIRDELLKFKNEADRVFVIKSGVEAAWSNTRGRNQWFKDNL